MSQRDKTQNGWISALPSLVVPVCLGLSLYIGLLALIRHGYIENELALRYLTGHPVSKISVAMFLIGAASLALIAVNVMGQFFAERHLYFAPLAEETHGDSSATQSGLDDVDRAVRLGQQLLDQPRRTHSHYLWQRLTNALLFVYRTGSAAGVDDEVKYLAEQDFDRQQQRYSLARILIWATPMLGFLGTVLGISQALGGISVGPDNDFKAMMDGLQSSLYVAFDTTALALTLSMVLMFAQFLVDRFETQLLSVVDQRARSEMASQFEAYGKTADAATAVEQLGQHLLNATQQMLVAQTDAWKTTVQSAQQSWTSSVQQTNDQVRSQLVESIQNTMQQLTQGLDGSLSRADDCMTRRWEQWQVLLSNNARLMSQHQQELVSQTQALQQLTQHSQTICEGSTNKAELNQSLAATTQAIVATRDLEAAIAGLSEQFKGVGVAPAEPLNATAEPIATKRGRKDVAVERRSDRTAAAPRRSAAPSISSFAEVAIPATTTNQQKPAAAIEEVILPIAPYLSGEKKLARSAGDQTSNRARPTAARKAA